MKMVIGKRSHIKVSCYQLAWILEWNRRINGMDYHFVAWFKRNDEGGAEQLMHVFIYPKWGVQRLIEF